MTDLDKTTRLTEIVLEFTTVAGLFALVLAVFFLLGALQGEGF